MANPIATVLGAIAAVSMLMVFVWSTLHPIAEVQDSVRGIHLAPASVEVSVLLVVYIGLFVIVPTIALAVALKLTGNELQYHKSNKFINFMSMQLRLPFDLPFRIPTPWYGSFNPTLLEALAILVWVAAMGFSATYDIVKSLDRFTPRGGPSYEDYLLTIGVGLGRVGVINLSVFLLPVSTNNLILKWLGVDKDRMVQVHRLIGSAIVLFILCHAFMITASYGWNLGGNNVWIQNVFGLVSTCGAGLILLTGHGLVRRYFYRVFYWSHALGYVLFFVFGILHHRFVLAHSAPAIIFFLTSKIIALTQSYSVVPVANTTSFTGENGDVALLTLVFEKEVQIGPGSNLMICLPHISWTEWHPYSIAKIDSVHGLTADFLLGSKSPPRDVHLVTIAIKSLGNWSTAAVELIHEQGTGVEVQVRGPFGGNPTLNGSYLAHDSVYFAAAGVGVTPLSCSFQAIANAPTGENEKRGPISFLWATSSEALASSIRDDLSTFAGKLGADSMVDIFVTKSGPRSKRDESVGSVNNPIDEKEISIEDDDLHVTKGDADHWRAKGVPYSEGLSSVEAVTGTILLMSLCIAGAMFWAYDARTQYWSAQTFLLESLLNILRLVGISVVLFYIGFKTHLSRNARGRMIAAVRLPEINPGKETNLAMHSNGDRPDVREHLKQHVERSVDAGSRSVGVSVCGPAGFVQEVRIAARLASKQCKVPVVVTAESYEW